MLYSGEIFGLVVEELQLLIGLRRENEESPIIREMEQLDFSKGSIGEKGSQRLRTCLGFSDDKGVEIFEILPISFLGDIDVEATAVRTVYDQEYAHGRDRDEETANQIKVTQKFGCLVSRKAASGDALRRYPITNDILQKNRAALGFCVSHFNNILSIFIPARRFPC